MHPIFFAFHSSLWWFFLLVLLTIITKLVVGLYSGRIRSTFDEGIILCYVMLMRLQLVVGLILYFAYSPYTRHFTFDMSNSQERFWSVEHPLLMLLSVGAAEVGYSRGKKSKKPKPQIIWLGLSLIFMLMGIPWDRVLT